ncbi:MAG TPA: N-acetylglutaminylglutamine amidotransferase, partial [Rhodospirillales bacterium]
MCGICGEIRFDGGAASTAAVQAMTDAMRRRGPDAGGVHAQGRAALGHRRLSIIDLSRHGQQPMIDSELGLALVFNGCIYNYKELKAELTEKGYRFFSASDTEVVLKAYHAWGIDCVKRFNGMFAFAVLERDSGRLVLARDRLGIKPLYISQTAGRLRFASSLPALLAAGDVDTGIDALALNHYMTFHAVVPAPFTIFNGVRKLPPATISVFEPDGRRKNEIYWEARFDQSRDDMRRSFEDWQEDVIEALRLAVRRRLVADVPVGVLLSGGVDSSLVVGLLAEAGQEGLNTFSIGFESVDAEEGNEFRYSDVIAERFATRHHKIAVGSERMMAALPSVIEAMSE